MTNYLKLLYGQFAHTNINVYLVIPSKNSLIMQATKIYSVKILRQKYVASNFS